MEGEYISFVDAEHPFEFPGITQHLAENKLHSSPGEIGHRHEKPRQLAEDPIAAGHRKEDQRQQNLQRQAPGDQPPVDPPPVLRKQNANRQQTNHPEKRAKKVIGHRLV